MLIAIIQPHRGKGEEKEIWMRKNGERINETVYTSLDWFLTHAHTLFFILFISDGALSRCGCRRIFVRSTLSCVLRWVKCQVCSCICVCVYWQCSSKSNQHGFFLGFLFLTHMKSQTNENRTPTKSSFTVYTISLRLVFFCISGLSFNPTICSNVSSVYPKYTAQTYRFVSYATLKI